MLKFIIVSLVCGNIALTFGQYGRPGHDLKALNRQSVLNQDLPLPNFTTLGSSSKSVSLPVQTPLASLSRKESSNVSLLTHQDQVSELSSTQQQLHQQKTKLNTPFDQSEKRIAAIEKQMQLITNYLNNQYKAIRQLNDTVTNIKRQIDLNRPTKCRGFV